MTMSMKASTVFGTRVAAPRSSMRARATPVTASLRNEAARWAKAAGVGAASLALTLGAQAATVKLGGDGGALVFDPASITIKAGDTVEWVNNVGFPHNVVFDEDEIPVYIHQVTKSTKFELLSSNLSGASGEINTCILQSGASADALSHEDYLNAPGQKVSSKFTTPGTYSYYCEPHQGAGMAGKIVVQ